MQLELTALGVQCRLQLLDLLGQRLGRLHGLGCLCDLGLPLGERRAGLLVVGRAYLPGRFRLLLLVFGLRVALLPLLLFALRLRAILLTVHGDRFPYPAGQRKSLLSISRREQAFGASQMEGRRDSSASIESIRPCGHIEYL